MQIDKSTFLQKLNRCYERLSLAVGATPETAFEDFLKIFLTKIYYEDKYERDMITDIALNETVLSQFEAVSMQCHDKLHCSQYFSKQELICRDAAAVSMAMKELRGFTLIELVDTNALQAFELFLQKYMRTRMIGLYTHPTLVHFLMGLLMPFPNFNYSGRLGDPVGGCGQFLTYYVRMGVHKMFSIGAICDDPLMVVAIRINLYIQGIRDHVADIRCRREEELASGYYDMIVSSIPDDNLELVTNAIDACSVNGRIGLIVNRKVFFGEECIDLRQYILHHTRIESITLVPENVFFNSSTIPNHCVVVLKKERPSSSNLHYNVAVSSVNDAGVSALGLATPNKQLQDVQRVVNEWQCTGIEAGGERTVFIDSHNLFIDEILDKIKNNITQYNSVYNIVQLSELLKEPQTEVVKPKIGRIYHRMMIETDMSPFMREVVYDAGNSNQIKVVSKGQFIIGLRGSSYFYHAIVPSSRRTIVIEPSWNVYDIDIEKIDPVYLHYILLSPAIDRQLKDYQSMNRNTRVSLSQILSLSIPLPSIEEQKLLIKNISLYSNQLQKVKLKLNESKASFYKLFEK